MAKSVYVGVDSRKVTITNLAPTINGKTGWTLSSSGGSISASSSITKYASSSLCISGTTSTGEACATSTATITVIPDHFYYLSYWYYTDTSGVRTNAYWPIAEPPFGVETVSQTNTWVKYIDIEKKHSANFSAGNYSMRLDFDNLNKAGKMYFDGLVLVDLTECFGSGNEPDETWCDENIPYFTGDIVIEQQTASGIARKVKKIYIGVDGVARRIIKGYCGVGGVARLFYSDDSVNDGTYWLLLKDGWTEYDASGNAVKTGAYGTWLCPSSGSYMVEIHGGGGGAGGVAMSYNTGIGFGSGDEEAAGGGGGGSGAVYTLTLTSGKSYTFSIGSAGTNGQSRETHGTEIVGGDGTAGGSSTFDAYTVRGGGGGTGGRAVADASINVWGDPGSRGSATEGYTEMIGTSGSDYYKPGTGNSTIGTYGDGGNTYGGTDVNPSPGAIIIRKSKGGELTYHGTTSSSLGYAVAYHSAANNPKYGIFAGGTTGTTYRANVYAYDLSLTRTSPSSNLSSAKKNMCGGSIGNYALFAGGRKSSTYYTAVTSYDTALTRGTATSLSEKLIGMSSASNGTYVMFVGGYIEAVEPTDIIYCYNTSLTQTTKSLSSAKGSVSAASVGGYFVLAGGYNDGIYSNELEIFDSSLTKLANKFLPTTDGRESMLSGVAGNYALFAGGDMQSSTLYKDVYAVNTSLTISTVTSLQHNRYLGDSVSNNGFVLFTGGRTSSDYARYSTATVDIYNDSLTRTNGTDMTVNRYNHCSTTVGNYALVGGGFNYVEDVGTNEVNSVDVYKVV